jgi:uncharacterized membrane protein
VEDVSVAQKRRGLRIHALAFVPSMLVLAITNLLTGEPYWIVWVLLAWGIGLLSHWLAVRHHSAGDVAL